MSLPQLTLGFIFSLPGVRLPYNYLTYKGPRAIILMLFRFSFRGGLILNVFLLMKIVPLLF